MGKTTMNCELFEVDLLPLEGRIDKRLENRTPAASMRQYLDPGQVRELLAEMGVELTALH
jgi:hypothetical protein